MYAHLMRFFFSTPAFTQTRICHIYFLCQIIISTIPPKFNKTRNKAQPLGSNCNIRTVQGMCWGFLYEAIDCRGYWGFPFSPYIYAFFVHTWNDFPWRRIINTKICNLGLAHLPIIYGFNFLSQLFEAWKLSNPPAIARHKAFSWMSFLVTGFFFCISIENHSHTCLWLYTYLNEF